MRVTYDTRPGPVGPWLLQFSAAREENSVDQTSSRRLSNNVDQIVGVTHHEVLDLSAQEWTLLKNDQWVKSVVERKMDVYVGSNPTWQNLWDAANARPTVFARELQQFTDAGYRWDGWYLRAPGH